jgi:hypothetical protein
MTPEQTDTKAPREKLLQALNHMRNVPGGRTSFQFQDEVVALFDGLTAELEEAKRKVAELEGRIASALT